MSAVWSGDIDPRLIRENVEAIEHSLDQVDETTWRKARTLIDELVAQGQSEGDGLASLQVEVALSDTTLRMETSGPGVERRRAAALSGRLSPGAPLRGPIAQREVGLADAISDRWGSDGDGTAWFEIDRARAWA